MMRLLLSESAVASLLMLKAPAPPLLRELAARGVNRMKSGKGTAAVVLTAAACALSAFLVLSAASIVRALMISTAGEAPWLRRLPEASAAGCTIFLAYAIDRLRDRLQKTALLAKITGVLREEVEKLQEENRRLREKEEQHSAETRRSQKEAATLNERLQEMRMEMEEKERKVATAEAHVAVFRKQSEELLLEYDRLLEHNQSLQLQLRELRGRR